MRSLKIKLYTVAKLLGLFKLAQLWTKNDLRILCYHGLAVYDEMSTHSDLFMTKQKFEQRIKCLREMNITILSLTEALDKLSKGDITKLSAVITFDDGFKDNLKIGLPLFEKYKIPVTIYVATYYVDHQGPVFVLMLQWMFRKTKKEEVKIEKMNKTFTLRSREERTIAINEVKAWGEEELNHTERMDWLAILGEDLLVPYEEAISHKMFFFLNSDEIKLLSSSCVDIELHTHRHTRCFENLDLAKEIKDNQDSLEKIIGNRPQHFCYPSGVWSPVVASTLRGLSIESAVTCDSGFNRQDTSKYTLNRFLDNESCSAIEFEAEVSGFAECIRRIMGIKRSRQDY